MFTAGHAALSAVDEIGANRASGFSDFNDWAGVERELATLEEMDVRVITYQDKEYPPSLRHVEDSPLVLYAKGALADQDRYAVAIVGSRMMSDYGRRMSERFATELARLGITVISGMARGVDTTAHWAALRAGGRSIAVLGCGIDRPYPPENRPLFDQLSQLGSVITEFPLGAPPNREHFPKRNRLISGISLGVLVVEAALDSGSLITASHALEQGREVFAIPGALTAKYSEGTNTLIKRGAKLVQRVEDILEELSPHLAGLPGVVTGLRGEVMPNGPGGLEISDEEKSICNALGTEPKHIDTIARETGTTPSRLSSILLSLEIKGIVRQLEGTRFSLAR
jgi:DNA processing protein